MKKKTTFTSIATSTLTILVAFLIAISSGNNKIVKPVNAEGDNVSNVVDLTSNAPNYAKDWKSTWSTSWTGSLNVPCSERVITSLDLEDNNADYSLEFIAAKNNGGISFRDTDFKIASIDSKTRFELHDYSKYIKSISWRLDYDSSDIGNTRSLSLYKNRDASGEPYQTLTGKYKEKGDLTVSFSDNEDERINAVVFKDLDNSNNNSRLPLFIEANNFEYELATASSTQQATFFSEAFLREMTCDGINSITNDVWDVFTTRINTMSAEALDILEESKADKSSESVIEQAMARYDLIAAKYNKDDFLNRGIVYSNLLGFFGMKDGNSSVAPVIIIAATASVILLSTLLIIKKKKHK